MKTSLLILISLLAFPLHAQVSVAARVGVFTDEAHDPAGAIELDARYGNWSISPAYEVIRGGSDAHAVHIDVRHYFHDTIRIGAGPTFASTTYGSKSTWNVDAGYAWRTKSGWEPFVAARYYTFRIPVFRDVVRETGPVISVGISRRLF
jgi:hypothetical protein